MLCINNSIPNVPETNFKQKIRCGEVYRNLNGDHTFQKFYYRCLECSMDFESGSDFEEHVIGHYLQEDEIIDDNTENANNSERNVIDISDDEDNAFLCAVEVTSVDETISASDLPLSLMQMLGQTTNSQQPVQPPLPTRDEDISESDSSEKTFPCKGLLNRSHQPFSDPDRCCPSCPGYFNSDLELDEHKIVHTLPNTVMCPYCYEVFANVMKLQQHTRTRRKKNSKSTFKKPCENNKGTKKKALNQSQDTPVKMETCEIDTDEKGKNTVVSQGLTNNVGQIDTTVTSSDSPTSNKDNGSNEIIDKIDSNSK